MEANWIEIATKAIDAEAENLHALSKQIWSKPELLFKEHAAHATLTEFLEKRGFKITSGWGGLDTSFCAAYQCGDGNGPHVVVISEYDALPEIGHACGHNLIAQSGVCAGIGIKAVMEKLGKPVGKLTVMGTPAEEGGCGKDYMLQAGCFKDVDIAMMVHPAPMNWTSPQTLAIKNVKVTYKGKASHASSFPWEGINALDAAVQAYTNLSTLRQQIKPTCRIHGVITKGGAKANVIPDLTELEYIIRAENVSDLNVLEKKVEACFRAAATATGCEADIVFDPRAYKDVLTNEILANTYEKYIVELEPNREYDPAKQFLGSTDMGNVTYAVPGIHPFYSIGDVLNHTRDFTTVAGAPESQPLTQNQGKAMAFTALEVLGSPQLLESVKQEFRNSRAFK